MQSNGKKKILAAVEDLFFTVKIADAAKRAGLDIEFLRSEKDLVERAKEKPLLIILDLNNPSVDAVKAVVKLKGSAETKPVSVIAFVSHIQAELKQKALEAGANMVMARSAFSQNLPQILKRHSGAV